MALVKFLTISPKCGNVDELYRSIYKELECKAAAWDCIVYEYAFPLLDLDLQISVSFVSGGETFTVDPDVYAIFRDKDDLSIEYFVAGEVLKLDRFTWCVVTSWVIYPIDEGTSECFDSRAF